MFSGGAAAEQPPAQQQTAAAAQQQQTWGENCQGATQQFTQCLDEQGGNMQICGWYLEQLVSLALLAWVGNGRYKSRTRLLTTLSYETESLPGGRTPVLNGHRFSRLQKGVSVLSGAERVDIDTSRRHHHGIGDRSKWIAWQGLL